MDIASNGTIVRIMLVAPHQRIDAFSAPKLRARLDFGMLEQGTTRFVLDLTAVPFLDSAAWRCWSAC